MSLDKGKIVINNIKEYNYTNIVRLDKSGILFSDDEFVDFEECKCEWMKEKCITTSDTVCVALRFIEGNDRYFIFYSKERVKLYFRFKGILKNKRSRDKFNEMQVLLNSFWDTSYDMS